MKETLLKGRRVDNTEEFQHFQQVFAAIMTARALKRRDPLGAYEIARSAVAYDKCPPQLYTQLLAELGSLCLDIGQPGEALKHFLTFERMTASSEDKGLVLYARWMVTVAMRDLALAGESVDVLEPLQLLDMARARMEEIHDESRSILDTHNGRFVFIASVVDRVPIEYAVRSPRERVVELLHGCDAALAMIREHGSEFGYLEGRAEKARAVYQAMLGQHGLALDTMEKAVAASSSEDPLGEAQARSARGSALLRARRFEEARAELDAAFTVAEQMRGQLAPGGKRLGFENLIRVLARNRVSADFGLFETSAEGFDEHELSRRLAVELEAISSDDLSNYLLQKLMPEPSDIGGADVSRVLADYEKRSGRTAYLVYVFCDDRGTHRQRWKGDTINTYGGYLDVGRRDWDALWQSLADSFALVRHHNPARPQDWADNSSFQKAWADVGGRFAQWLTSDIQPGSHLFLCLDPVMQRLPLGAAPLEDEPLISRHTLSVVPSARGLVALSVSQSHKSKKFVSFGVGSSQDEHRMRPQSVAAFHVVGDYLQAKGALEGSDNHKWREASTAALRAALGDSERVMLTCHGRFDPTKGLQSGVFLARDGELAEWPYPSLTAQEISNMDASTDFVGLNACVVGLSRLRGIGDELGLSWALYRSGVRSHVVALWPVYLKSGNAFMCALYDALEAGAPTYADATRQAMLRTRGSYPHLFHWAPFVHRGISMPTVS